MTKLTITKIGNSKGIILPKELLAKLGLGKGDKLLATETSEGIHLAPCNADLARMMGIIESVMQQDHNALKKLVK